MIELKENFVGTGEVKGFEFRQLKKNGKAFLYEVKSEYNYDGVPEIDVWYEVFERKISKENERMIGEEKVVFEEREMYPRSNAFGVWAFCINSYDYACKKFHEITKIVTEREEKRNK